MKMMSGARFLVILLISLGVMYLLSQSLIATWSDFEILNVSNFYIALTMASAMALIMAIGMWNFDDSASLTGHPHVPEFHDRTARGNKALQRNHQFPAARD